MAERKSARKVAVLPSAAGKVRKSGKANPRRRPPTDDIQRLAVPGPVLSRFLKRGGSSRNSPKSHHQLNRLVQSTTRRITRNAMRLAAVDGRSTIMTGDMQRALNIEGIHFC